MKKTIPFFILFLLSMNLASAVCNLSVDLINQDPYPAVPGDYVKILFQIRGIENKDCEDVNFLLVPEYPFSTDPEQELTLKIKGGTYTQDFNSYLMAPYRVRVDPAAMDGDNKIKIKYSTDKTKSVFIVEEFDINIHEVKTDFEIFIKDYDASKRTITFEILNSGKNNIEALTFQIPKQENIEVKGSSSNIIGSLDANDFTTTTFEAIPRQGEITINLTYTDSINKRRQIEKTILFKPEYFQGRLRDEKQTSLLIYIIPILIILIIIYYFYKKRQKAKKKKLFG